MYTLFFSRWCDPATESQTISGYCQLYVDKLVPGLAPGSFEICLVAVLIGKLGLITNVTHAETWVTRDILQNLEGLPEEHRLTVSNFMSFAHTSVNEISKIYLEHEKRYNYTTPKSFLEQIALYTKLIKEKQENLKNMIERLENGLEKLEACGGQVSKFTFFFDCLMFTKCICYGVFIFNQADALKEILAVQEVELKKKNEVADKILAEVTAENTKAEVEKAIGMNEWTNYYFSADSRWFSIIISVVSEEEAKVAEIKEQVTITQRKCDLDLQKAEPAVRKAEEALNTLNKVNLFSFLTALSGNENVPNTFRTISQN